MKVSLIITFLSVIIRAQVTGLEGWDLFIDPGHSQDENMGINGYSEAREVLKVGLHLKDILENQSDIDTVYISRTNDNRASLFTSERIMQTPLAHPGTIQFTAMLVQIQIQTKHYYYGVSLTMGIPDPPVGGEDMSSLMIDLLTDGMRIETTGSAALG